MAEKQRVVAVVAFEGVQSLDVVGPLEVFAATNREVAPDQRYRIEVLAKQPGPVRCSSGLSLVADRAYASVRGPLDTLLVAGGDGTGDAVADAQLLRWLGRIARRTRRVGSVCTGAFVLAAAGLLDGKRATTHWQWSEALSRAFPSVRVEDDALFLCDGGVYTSAGVSAGMDLALALVEADHGHRVALRVARQLVMFLRRSGGQSQFSAELAAQLTEREPLRELVAKVAERPGAQWTVAELARAVAMSPRNFARVFSREVGTTPARFVELVRLEAARRRLEQSEAGLDRIAADCGFGSAETLRRSFLRNVGVTPGAYRERFRPAGPSLEIAS